MGSWTLSRVARACQNPRSYLWRSLPLSCSPSPDPPASCADGLGLGEEVKGVKLGYGQASGIVHFKTGRALLSAHFPYGRLQHGLKPRDKGLLSPKSLARNGNGSKLVQKFGNVSHARPCVCVFVCS